MSADPVNPAAVAARAESNEKSKMTSFGIKLKKLEISNMSVAKPQDADVEPSKQFSLLE